MDGITKYVVLGHTGIVHQLIHVLTLRLEGLTTFFSLHFAFHQHVVFEQTRKDQRTAFGIVDNNIGLDMDIALRCFGEYSYKIVDPMLFYTNVCGNVTADYARESIDGMLKTELLTALQPAFAKISAMGIRYSAVPGHTAELAEVRNEVLSQKRANFRGVKVASFGVSSITANEEDEVTIKELQKSAVFRNPNMAAAHLVGAQAEAMKTAAANEGGMGKDCAKGISPYLTGLKQFTVGDMKGHLAYREENKRSSSVPPHAHHGLLKQALYRRQQRTMAYKPPCPLQG